MRSATSERHRDREIRRRVKEEAVASLAAAFVDQVEWRDLIDEYGYSVVAREVNKIIDFLVPDSSVCFNSEQQEAS